MDDLKGYIAGLRKDFSGRPLDELSVDRDPVRQFETWFRETLESKVQESHAMTICTVDNQGRPSARVVYMRDFSEAGFSFFTNYNSQKGADIAVQPLVCLNFFWPELERQVRISGNASKLPAEVSDEYFNSRPRGSKVGAWASPQSEQITTRSALDERYKQMEARFEGSEVPRPAHWGGYLVKPEKMEFWQGRPNRFHDRIVYVLTSTGWEIKRLAP